MSKIRWEAVFYNGGCDFLHIIWYPAEFSFYFI